MSGILPQVKTRVYVPLKALDSQTMFFPRQPGQLKMVIHGNKVDLGLVNRIQIGVQKSSFNQHLDISNVGLTNREPVYTLPDVKLVDEFGQWTQKNWPGKMRSEEELVRYLQAESRVKADNSLTDFSEQWSEYGIRTKSNLSHFSKK